MRKLINLDIKKEINSKRESGKSVGDLSAECGMAFHVCKIFMLLLWKVQLQFSLGKPQT